MKWTTGPIFRRVVRAALILSVTWFALLMALGDNVNTEVRGRLGPLLVAVAVLAGIFDFVLRSTPVLREPISRERRGSAKIVVYRTPEQVWNFIRDPAFAPQTSEITERAFVVPGTPDGPGQQQVFLTREPNGELSLSLIEIAAESPWTSVAVTHVTGGGWSTYELEPVPTGTLLTMTIAGDFPKWRLYQISPQEYLQARAADYVRNVKAVMEGGAVPSTLPSAPPSHGSSQDPTEHGPTEPTTPDVPPPFNPGNPPPST